MAEQIVKVSVEQAGEIVESLEIIPVNITSTSVTYTVYSVLSPDTPIKCFSFKTSPGRGKFQLSAKALAILARRIHLLKK